MSKVQLNAELVRKEQLKPDIFKFAIKANEIATQARPGQFMEIRVNNQVEPFLRRPISIHNIDGNIVEFIFQVKGKGTTILAQKEVGDLIDVIGPLGEGTFDCKKYNKLAIIGGGIGIFPLYELCKIAKKDGKEVNTYLGFRNKDLVILEKDFKNVSTNFCLATDDGSYGKNGFIINFLEKDIEKGKIDSIYACGPIPMLRAIQKLAAEKNVPCQISLEENIACGMGVCVGCAVKTASSSKENPIYIKLCSAGPVFESTMVDF